MPRQGRMPSQKRLEAAEIDQRPYRSQWGRRAPQSPKQLTSVSTTTTTGSR